MPMIVRLRLLKDLQDRYPMYAIEDAGKFAAPIAQPIDNEQGVTQRDDAGRPRVQVNLDLVVRLLHLPVFGRGLSAEAAERLLDSVMAIDRCVRRAD